MPGPAPQARGWRRKGSPSVKLTASSPGKFSRRMAAEWPAGWDQAGDAGSPPAPGEPCVARARPGGLAVPRCTPRAVPDREPGAVRAGSPIWAGMGGRALCVLLRAAGVQSQASDCPSPGRRSRVWAQRPRWLHHTALLPRVRGVGGLHPRKEEHSSVAMSKVAGTRREAQHWPRSRRHLWGQGHTCRRHLRAGPGYRLPTEASLFLPGPSVVASARPLLVGGFVCFVPSMTLQWSLGVLPG